MFELYFLIDTSDIYRIGRDSDSVFVDRYKYTGYVYIYLISFSYVSAALGLLFPVYQYKSLGYAVIEYARDSCFSTHVF